MFGSFNKVLYLILLLIFIMAPVDAGGRNDPSLGIVVNLPSRTLELYSGDNLIKEYPVAIGKPSTPTPMGNYSIIDKEIDPVWIPPGRGFVVASGPDNPLGYRWMGFASLYGIHGTNAPWSIGLAVSNGCIRMNEEHAEDLFELVKYGTPVKIIYERVKVGIDSEGQATIGIYPDIYGYETVTLADVNNKLAEHNLNGLLSEEFLLTAIREGTDKQVAFAKLNNIKVNNNLLTKRAISIDNSIYVPVWPVAEVLESNIVWDEQNQIIWNNKKAVVGVVKGDIIYVTPENLQHLFGGQQIFKTEENCLEVNILR